MTDAGTRRPWVAWGLLATLVALQVGLVLVHLGRGTVQAHDVPVVLQGPDLLAQSTATRLNRLPDHPVRALVLPEDADPKGPVRDGKATGALVMDLTAEDNVLLVSSVNDPELNRLLGELATSVGKVMARGVDTSEVTPRKHPAPSRTTVHLLGGLWVVLGFLVLVVWWRVGRSRARRPFQGALFPLQLAGVCALVSLGVAAVTAALGPGELGTLWAVGFGAMYAVAIATAALEVLFGLVGVAVAATLFVFLGGPLFSVRDVHLLPTPWRQVSPWTPHGAAVELTSSLSWFGSSGLAQPVRVLAGTVLVSLVVLLTVGWLRVAEPEEGSTPGRWRLRVMALAVPTAMVVLGAVVLAPQARPVVSAEAGPRAAATECVARPKISNVDQLNDFVETVRGGSAFQGADVGADVRLQDGRRLWVFADTLRAKDFPGQQFVRNSMLVFDPSCVESVLPAGGGALIPDRGDGIGYWPMSIGREQRDGYDLVGVAAQRVKATDAPDGIFAFETLGPAMAVFVVPRGKTPQLLGRVDIGPDKVDTTRPMWGAASVDDDGWLYLYGTSRPDAKGIFGYSLQVARTRVAGLLDPGSWTYWDGKRWQKSAARAKVLIPSEGGVSQTLSVFKRGRTWYAVSKRNEVLGTDLVVWRAPSPTGPWDGGTKVADLPSDPKTGELRYMPLAHPDLDDDPATVLVSYSRNNTDASKVDDDPFLYRPLFLRATLPR